MSDELASIIFPTSGERPSGQQVARLMWRCHALQSRFGVGRRDPQFYGKAARRRAKAVASSLAQGHV